MVALAADSETRSGRSTALSTGGPGAREHLSVLKVKHIKNMFCVKSRNSEGQLGETRTLWMCFEPMIFLDVSLNAHPESAGDFHHWTVDLAFLLWSWLKCAPTHVWTFSTPLTNWPNTSCWVCWTLCWQLLLSCFTCVCSHLHELFAHACICQLLQPWFYLGTRFSN